MAEIIDIKGVRKALDPVIQVTVDRGNHKEFLVTMPSAAIMRGVESEITERATTFKLAGFRSGKVPLSIVKRQIGMEVLSKHVDKQANLILQQILTDYHLTPIVAPKIDITDFKPEKDLVLTIVVEGLPQIPAINWEDPAFKIQSLELVITEADMQEGYRNVLQALAPHYEKMAEEYAAQRGDAVVLDFRGYIKGEEFEGNKASAMRIVIGSGEFIKDFEEQLLGVKLGDKKEITVHFPSDYHDAALAGQEVCFHTSIDEVQHQNPAPQMSEAVVKSMGFENMEKFDAMLKQRLTGEFTFVSRLLIKKNLFDALDKYCQVDIPEMMVESDTNLLWKELEKSGRASTANKPEEVLREELRVMARRRVKLGLVLAELARSHDITVKEEDFREAVRAEVAHNKHKETEVLDFYGKQENLDSIKGRILEEKIVDFMMSKVPSERISITSKDFKDQYGNELKELAGINAT